MSTSSPRSAVFDPDFLADLRWWLEKDRGAAVRVMDLVDACLRDPFVGIGKPEPLRHNLSGLWSRRIDQKHRVVFSVRKDAVLFLQARFHY